MFNTDFIIMQHGGVKMYRPRPWSTNEQPFCHWADTKAVPTTGLLPGNSKSRKMPCLSHPVISCWQWALSHRRHAPGSRPVSLSPPGHLDWQGTLGGQSSLGTSGLGSQLFLWHLYSQLIEKRRLVQISQLCKSSTDCTRAGKDPDEPPQKKKKKSRQRTGSVERIKQSLPGRQYQT